MNRDDPAGNADVPVGSSPNPKGWYTRGYLPHRDDPRLIQSITFRLADSLPQSKLKQLKKDLLQLPEPERKTAERLKIEQWLDSGMGCCALRHPKVAEYLEDTLLHFHGDRYDLHAWCIMPNHVHLLVQTHHEMGTIVQAWKSFSARWILNQNESFKLGIPKPDQLWMREYWDRYIRNEEHYNNALNYIHQNPVKAGLCKNPEDWPWSSAGNADVPVGKPKP